MKLPFDFQFSQNNLQDLVDCPRRFYLRNLLHLEWPALESEPAQTREKEMRLGQSFHQLVHQNILGIVDSDPNLVFSDGEISTWWQNYLSFFSQIPDAILLPEYPLTAPFASFRLLAKFDLLVVNPGKSILVIDWKTNRFLPKRSWLENRLQTKVYLFMLALAGQKLFQSKDLVSEQISLMYWFPNFPSQPITFDYSSAQFSKDSAYLHQLVEQVIRSNEDDFLKTSNEKTCLFCNYRSLCLRGGQAGHWSETEDLENSNIPNPELDFDQMAEIEF